MKSYSLSHVANDALLHNTVVLATRRRATNADLLAHIAEIEARKLYLPAAYESLLAYCVGELKLTRAEALIRIRVARVARRFPVIFEALADSRLNLTAVILLKRYLSEASVKELIAAAAHKDKPEIQQLIADRFPSLDVPAQVVELPPSPRRVAAAQVCPDTLAAPVVSPETLVTAAPKVAPLSSVAFSIQYTMSRNSRDRLRYAQELLSHELPSGDIAQVMDQALDALIEKLEKRKFAATSKPRPGRASGSPRHVPADVKREVWRRDGGQCTFESESGRRCSSRERLEFDHVLERARGGESTVDNLRLRCQAHNQYTAEHAFGAAFMNEKRRTAAEARAEAKARKDAAAAAERAKELDVIPWLRQLGFRTDEARRAAKRCESIPDAPLEERVRVALRSLAPISARKICFDSAGSSAPSPS